MPSFFSAQSWYVYQALWNLIYSPGYPEFMILLPLPPKFQDYKYIPTRLARVVLLKNSMTSEVRGQSHQELSWIFETG